ncbi:MAG: hypothetical protein M3Y60_01305 [Bacteroidota bacterium]|nr:hypothetical protein [Bacteroidota bacterium]
MKHLCPFVLTLLLISCAQKNAIDELQLQQSLDSLKNNMTQIDQEAVASILDQIPSPLEISMLIKQSGSGYNRGLLNSPQHISRYNSSYQKALNLGIYGADLGYTNLFEENVDGIRYLSAIKSLANDLNIGQFFNANVIGRLATNSSNLDSLLLMTTQSFNAINRHLQNQNRSNLSVLLLAGGWIEAMEIICEVSVQNPDNRALIESIGEQKIVLEQLVLLLSFFTSDPNIAALYQDFEQLKTIYDNIEISFTYVESTVKVVNGVAVISDNSTTTIEITEADARAIRQKINSIRNKMTN